MSKLFKNVPILNSYLTDFRENTLQDVITKIEPDLFQTVTGLTVKDFHLLVRHKVFNTEHMNQTVFAFRRYEDASLRYTGIESHEGLTTTVFMILRWRGREWLTPSCGVVSSKSTLPSDQAVAPSWNIDPCKDIIPVGCPRFIVSWNPLQRFRNFHLKIAIPLFARG